MTSLVWPSILLILGLFLVGLEAFVPSAGVIGFLSVASVVASVVMAFTQGGVDQGLVFLLLASVGMPLMLYLSFKSWPHTPIGRRILLQIPTSEEVLPHDPQRQWLRQLVGRRAVAISKMLPSGIIEIEGKSIDALTDGSAVEPGQQVQIVEVRGNRVLVTPVTAGSAAPEPYRADNVLTHPVTEELGSDPFREE